MDGFLIDLSALTRAAEGIRDAIAAVETSLADDLSLPEHAVGHEDLSGALIDFRTLVGRSPIADH